MLLRNLIKTCKLGNHLVKIIGVALILTYALFGHSGAFALTDAEKIAQLRAEIEKLQEQEVVYRGTIAQTQAQAATLKNQISGLQNQILQLQIQVQLTGKKIDQTSIELGNVEDSISVTQQKINAEKDTISQLLLFLNREENTNLLSILIKSASISDYFSQAQHALSINSTLLDKVTSLQKAEDELNMQKGELEAKKQDLRSLKSQQDAQKNSLAVVKADKNSLLAVTKGEEAKYQKLLTAAQIQEANFFNQLRELETRVIQGGLYIVHVTASSLPKKGTKLFSWPESGYRLTQGYGCTTYARCGSTRGAYGGSPHNGIDIAAGFSSPIRAIGAGEIIANGRNDGWGNWVAIQHPDQYNLVSIYAHMSALSFLQVGTKVTEGQTIGFEGNTGNARGSHLHLSLYKNFFTYVNEKKNQLYFNYFEGTVNPLDYL